MARVFLLHWHESEGKAYAAALRSRGHKVALHWNAETHAPLKDALPEIALISLERLPSHGRAVAEWLWEAKKRRHIPIVFFGGEPAKVAATRARFPSARYCEVAALTETLGQVARALPSTGGEAPTKPAKRRARGKPGHH